MHVLLAFSSKAVTLSWGDPWSTVCACLIAMSRIEGTHSDEDGARETFGMSAGHVSSSFKVATIAVGDSV